MSETKKEIINITSRLINTSEAMGLHVNKGKTNYIVILKRLPSIYSFGVVI